MMTPERAQLEALLFATDVPLTLQRLAELLVLPVGRIERELELLEEYYLSNGHSLSIAREGSSIRLRTRPEFAQLLMAVRGETARLTRPALEVLSILAMRGSASRAEIDKLRGVDSDSVVTGLVGRGLIEESTRDDTPGRAARFRVTDLFLTLFGVTKIEDLQLEFTKDESELLPLTEAAATTEEAAPSVTSETPAVEQLIVDSTDEPADEVTPAELPETVAEETEVEELETSGDVQAETSEPTSNSPDTESDHD